MTQLKLFISLTLLTIGSVVGALAQDLPRIDEQFSAKDSPKLQEALAKLMHAPTSTESLEMATLRGTSRTELASGRVRVIIETYSPETMNAVQLAVLTAGGDFEGSYQLFVQALVPIEALAALADQPDVRAVRFPHVLMPYQGTTVSQGRHTLGADAWQQAGYKGQGVKVAVFDVGFRGYKSLLGQELPPADRVIARAFGMPVEGFSSDPDDEAGHGTGVAEIVYDIAPDAQFFLVNALTVEVNVPQAVEYLLQQGVNVINTSWGAFTGCLKGGFLEGQFQRVRQAGATWVAASGNDGQGHWLGNFRDDDNDGQLNFTATDETNSFQANADDLVDIVLSWEDPCHPSKNNYDLLLLDSSLNVVARSSENNEFTSAAESIRLRIPEQGTYHIAVQKAPEAQPVKLDLILYNLRLEYSVAQESVSFFEPAISSNVLTVGAVFWQSNRVERFSSQGPTKDGRMKPDISAPDGVISRTFDPFFGTSASSPHAAGAAVLVKQAFPEYSPQKIQEFLAARAEDFGTPGPDNQYGAGVLLLGQPPNQPPAPTITGIEPASGLQGTTVQATVSGTNLSGATGVTFSSFGVTAVIQQGGTDTTLPIAITISPDAPPGARTFSVKTPNGTAANNGQISFTVLQAPHIQLEPVSLSFRAVVGGNDPPPQTLHITNVGSGALNWQAAVDVPWLRLSAAEGTTPGEINVSAAIAGLTAGTHEGRITITALGNPLVLPVTLALEPPSGELIVLVFQKLEFPIPEDWTVTLQNNCETHQNSSRGPSRVRVVLPDSTEREFEVPVGREVIVCGNVAHIDTRNS